MGLDLIQVCTGKISAGLDSGYGWSMQGNPNMIGKFTIYSFLQCFKFLCNVTQTNRFVKTRSLKLKKGTWNKQKITWDKTLKIYMSDFLKVWILGSRIPDII